MGDRAPAGSGNLRYKVHLLLLSSWLYAVGGEGRKDVKVGTCGWGRAGQISRHARVEGMVLTQGEIDEQYTSAHRRHDTQRTARAERVI